MNTTARIWPRLAAFAAAAIVVQLSLSAVGKVYYLTQLTMAVYYSIVVMGLSLLMGYAGQVSLGQGAFFAIGGYTSAFLTTHNMAGYRGAAWFDLLDKCGVIVSRKSLYDDTLVLTVAPWLAFMVAILLTVVIAAVIGYPSLRLRGHYLAMATLGFGLIIHCVLIGSPALGAADGITGVPRLSVGGLAVSGKSAVRVQNYYIAWAVAIAVLVLLRNLVESRMGRALRAIHDSEAAASAMGVNTPKLKLEVFMVSAALAAMAGSLLTHYNEGIGPSESSAFKSVRYLALVAAGGVANLEGALVVSTLLVFLSLRGWFGTYDNAVFGIILIAIVALAPQGPFRQLGLWMGRCRTLYKPGKEARSGAS
ncbi:MAG TPA: branched-chain amino acid ABC transporter permease [Verrucomicrobiota bacterium]|nr:branched-chain amino acid ABC transporter permease [Verrucomicrobiota bacterium]